MMWLNTLLLMLRIGSSDPVNYRMYWSIVDHERAAGCRVYNYIYDSCPGMDRIGGMAIPADAVEYYEEPILQRLPNRIPRGWGRR
jgi:hypothetical protein